MRTQFRATDIETGEQITIFEARDQLDTRNLSGDEDQLLGLVSYSLADGTHLNVSRGGLFVTTDGRRTFRRD